MIGALRQLAERPIAEGERRAAFFIAAAIVLAAATLLNGEGDSLPSPATSSTPTVPPAGGPPPTAQRSEPEAAAVRFLDGYLPFLYGQGAAKSIRAAMPQLVERLVRSRVRVAPAARSRCPRLEAIGGPSHAGSRALVKARCSKKSPAAEAYDDVKSAAPDSPESYFTRLCRPAFLKARVGDGAVSYTLALTVVQRSGRWLVRSVGGE